MCSGGVFFNANAKHSRIIYNMQVVVGFSSVEHFVEQCNEQLIHKYLIKYQ